MPPRKKSTNPVVATLVLQAQSLSAADRQLLIVLLRQQGPRSPHYALLESALWSAQRITLAHHPTLKAEADKACEYIDTQLAMLTDKRERLAVLCAVIKATESWLLHDGQPVNTLTLLRAANFHSWTWLLDRIYPGYNLRLLARVLCRTVLTSPASSANTA